MTTVPKLNYTNLRNKSKSKEGELPERKPENPQNDLFAHMNQDNLKYIQNQIKQKNRKANLSARQEESLHLKSYPQLIEEKESKYEETEREPEDQEQDSPNSNPVKTEGENVKINQVDLLNRNRRSEDAETYKLSYYDLVSQAKSKRISSIQGFMDEEKGTLNKDQNFLLFLENYISDLNKARSKVKKPIQEKQNKETSGVGEKHIFMKAVAEEKKKNVIMAKQIERYRAKQDENGRRIQALEGVVTLLSQQLDSLRKQFRLEREQHRQQFRSMGMTMDLRPDNSRLSRNSQLPLRGSMESRFLRKDKYQQEEILRLERELRLFNQTGETS